jgi:hypothetical protein
MTDNENGVGSTGTAERFAGVIGDWKRTVCRLIIYLYEYIIVHDF